MHTFLTVVIVAKLAAAWPAIQPSEHETHYKRVPPMSFACDELPDICTSMCWGAYCTEPQFGATLYFDNPTESTKSSRRTSAGCQPRPNRCSVNHNPAYGTTGYNCDEYPFASTSDADKGGQTNRCVPKSQNSAQGAIINNYISGSCNCQPCSFIVGFGNPASPGVKYCDAYDDRHNKCIPDDNTYKGQNPDVQPPAAAKKRGLARTAHGGIYVTKRGMEVSFAEELEPGTPIKHARARRDTLTVRDATCDTGDGDEWDNGEDGMRRRSSKAEPMGDVDYEIVDDFIMHKKE